jgi:4-hydroxy-tetrahydrodipicolinate synthase
MAVTRGDRQSELSATQEAIVETGIERGQLYRPTGVIVAAVTPFHPDESVNIPGLQSHVNFLASSGMHAIMVAAGSGEYVNLSLNEKKQVIDATVEAVSGRVPIIVGALSPSTREAVEVGCYAAKSGATALLVLPPYYIKPSLDGVVDHFGAIARETGLPVIAYNNPGRIGWNIDVPMLQAIASVPGVVGLKDCDRDLASISAKIQHVGSTLNILSGDDDLCFASLLSGAVGATMASPNAAPKLCLDLYRACTENNIDEALRLHNRLRPFVHSWLIPNHPGPLKETMAMLGRPIGPARRPLQPMTAVQRQVVESVIREYGPFR